MLVVTVELESIASSPCRSERPANRVVELVTLSKAMALVACRCLPVLVDRLGGPLGVRIPSDSFTQWLNEDNLKEFVRRIFTNSVRRIRDSQSPTWQPAHSSATD